MVNGEERTAVVLDDQPLWLDALEQLLARANVRVVGKTTQVESAIGLVGEFRPDVLIASTDAADVPDGGIRCIARAHQEWPGLKSVVLAPDYDPRQIEAAFAAGASVCCIKRAAVDDLAVAIRQAFDHSIFLASSHGVPVAERTMMVSEAGREKGSNLLTRREIEILRLVAEGHSNSALAKMLWVTEQTVKFHLANIYRKLDVANRTEASRWAHLNGILMPTGPAVNAA
jgi:DNA-binding NarL/FixJ family response regulator